MNTLESNAPNPDSRVGLIAGSGQFPLLFAHAALQAGVEVVAVGFDGETDPALARYVGEFHLLKLGQLNRLIKIFQNAGVRRAAMAGAINKTRLYTRIRPDWRTVKLINRMRNKKDDFLLRTFAEELESEGIRIEPSTLFLPGLLAREGILTRRKPNRREQADITFGWRIAKVVGTLDIGQCLVVKNQAVLAVEGMDGTDATILRGGRLCGEGAVVVKVSKPTQDLRFDVPSVGLGTIETMRRVHARILVVEAGKTLMFDRERMIDLADDAGITILVYADEDIPSEDHSRTADPLTYAARPAIAKGVNFERADGAVLVRPHNEQAFRVGVVGVGYLGTYHAQKYARLPEANLTAVVDVNDERAGRVARDVGARPLTDYRELFGQVDAVSIVTPTSHHYSIAAEFLAQGIHVMLEKPMTETLAQADHLIALAKENGCVLQIGHLERFNPAFRAIYPRLSNPMFLEADRLALFNERGLEVDVILDLMIHDIDIVLHIMNSPVRHIRVAGIPVLTALPDIANVRLEFENGAIANLTASRISVKNLRKLRIFQENCYMVADYANKVAYAFYREDESDDAGFPQISMEELEIIEGDALEEEIASFLAAIRKGEKPLVDGYAGRQALAVALEISRQIDEQIQKTWGLSRVAPSKSS